MAYADKNKKSTSVSAGSSKSPASNASTVIRTSPGPKAKSSPRFRLGAAVEARFQGKSKYYTGRVAAVSRNGTYTIYYDDGDMEDDVPAEMIRAFGRNRRESRCGGAN